MTRTLHQTIKFRSIIPIVLILLLIYIPLCAEGQKTKFERLPEGISDLNTNCIIQDKFGFMWFGTNNGLNRFDGLSYKIYEHDLRESNSLSNNWISDIAEDDSGNLWIATFGGGLNYFDRTTERFTVYKNNPSDPSSLSSNTISKLFIDSDQHLWICTDGGLNTIPKGSKKIQRINTHKLLQTSYISTIAEDEHQNLWLGTMGKGLIIYHKKNKQVLQIPSLPSAQGQPQATNIRSMLKDRRGNIWIGTLEAGLYQASIDEYKKPSFKRFVHEGANAQSLSNNTVLSIYEDAASRIWVGTENGGLELFMPANGTFKHHVHSPDNEYSIASNSIWSICEDMSGTLWIGTFNQGVCKIDPNSDKFKSLNRSDRTFEPLYKNTISSMLELNAETILVGTDGDGIYAWNMLQNTFTHYPAKPGSAGSLSSSVVLSLMRDRSNDFWLGTWGGGFNRVKNASFSPTGFQQGHNGENVFTTDEDREGNIWVGTWGAGLYRINKASKAERRFSQDNNDKKSISSSNIFKVFIDSHQRMWVGTLNGLNLVRNLSDKLSFEHFFHSDGAASLSSNSVLTIFEDSHSVIWIGTAAGLDCYNPKDNSISRSSLPELCKREIKSILEDEHGNLWIGTNKGLLRYNVRKQEVSSFDKSDGVLVNTFSIGACMKRTNGAFLFGGNKGLVYFYPDSVKSNPIQPPVYITDFKIFNKSIKPSSDSPLSKSSMFTDEIVISYKDAVISFEFIGLNYTHPEKNCYSYRLDGLEKEWNDVGNLRVASYSSLEPGEYTFLVRASNNDKVWSDKPAQIRLLVRPPFWHTWWFRVLFSLMVSSLIYWLYRKRLERISNQLAAKEKLYDSMKNADEKEIIRLKNEKLNADIDFKNKELASITMNMNQKNEKLINLRDKISLISDEAEKTIQRKLKTLVSDIENDIENDQNWESFEMSFNVIHNNFLTRFAEQFPKITHNDLRMCALIRMNMSNKEISNMLNITLRSVESSRYRLRKKIDLDPEINLNDFIIRF